MLSNVDFPEPLGPTMAVNSPGAIRNDTPPRAWTRVGPKTFATSTASIAQSPEREGTDSDRWNNEFISPSHIALLDLDHSVQKCPELNRYVRGLAVGYDLHCVPASSHGDQRLDRNLQHVLLDGVVEGDVDVCRRDALNDRPLGQDDRHRDHGLLAAVLVGTFHGCTDPRHPALDSPPIRQRDV